MTHVEQVQSTPAGLQGRPHADRLWHPRQVLCAVCTNRTRGFGWFDPRRPRPNGIRRWFCSMGCQAAFTHKAWKGLHMVDFTEEETQALPAVMRALAPVMDRIGWDRPLSSLSANDMQRLIVTTVEAFRAEMLAIASDMEVPF